MKLTATDSLRDKNTLRGGYILVFTPTTTQKIYVINHPRKKNLQKRPNHEDIHNPKKPFFCWPLNQRNTRGKFIPPALSPNGGPTTRFLVPEVK